MNLRGWFLVGTILSCTQASFVANLEEGNTNLLDNFCNNGIKKSGYINVSDNKDLFYLWFASQSHSESKPLILWLNGGPGTSSLRGLVEGIGPCNIGENNTLEPNNYSWHEFANLLFLDQPVGTGMSFNKSANSVNTSEQAASDMLRFLTKFYIQFPQFSKVDLYIFGESYAGYFIPELATKIIAHNKNDSNIPLKAIGISNGFFDPQIQYTNMIDVVCEKKLIAQEICQKMSKKIRKTEKDLLQCQKTKKARFCQKVMYRIQAIIMEPIVNSNIIPYNLNEDSNVYGEKLQTYYDKITTFFNLPSTQQQLQVNGKFNHESNELFDQFESAGDNAHSRLPILQNLLATDLEIFLLAGEFDGLFNYKTANQIWVHLTQNEIPELEQDNTIYYRNKKIGFQRSYKNLKFFSIANAGHFLSVDQPSSLYHIMKSYIISSSDKGNSINDTGSTTMLIDSSSNTNPLLTSDLTHNTDLLQPSFRCRSPMIL